jgi:hypothetical protein
MAKRLRPLFDYESYVARTNLEKSPELKWFEDASYFWAAIVKMKRRSLRRGKDRMRELSNGQTPPS